MKILVDADACPVTEDIIDEARKRRMEVCLFSNFCHQHPDRDGVRVFTLDNAPEASDFALMNHAEPDDIAVTQDHGLACMLLGKKTRILSPRGRLYTPENIDRLMQVRHITRKRKRSGKKIRGKQPPFSENDRQKFMSNFIALLEDKP